MARRRPGAMRAAVGALMAAASHAVAEEIPRAADRQSLDDAWWTGPIIAAGATTLPRGHFLVEPYFYDVIRYGRYDSDGEERDATRVDGFGSLTYALYGLTDDFTVGMIPTFGYNVDSSGPDSSGIGVGDLSLQAQYQLSRFREGSRVPTTSLVLQQGFPIGKYDRLGDRPGDGLGSGAYTTMLGLYSQYYFWMPNGRILRTRLNLTYSILGDADVADVSVYGTAEGFRGHASPGNSSSVTLSGEYSITRNWVLALDLYYQHDDNTRVSGYRMEDVDGVPQRVNIAENSGTSWRFAIAPAIEYNWTSTIGVIAGVRWFAAGHNTPASITPVVAINMVY
jgi:hypothetical protein